MKGLKLFTSAVALVCVVCMLFAGCAKGNKFTDDKDGRYVDGKTKIAYLSAPACYEPIKMGEELYGTLGKTELYTVVGADPKMWLCEPSGSVLYAEEIQLPTLSQMNVSYVEITDDDGTVTTLRDSAVIGALVNAYTQGQTLRRPMVTENAYSVNWRIKFADETIGIRYVLAYIELKEDHTELNDDGTETNYGKKFIFNRFDGTCVAAGDVLDSVVSAQASK